MTDREQIGRKSFALSDDPTEEIELEDLGRDRLLESQQGINGSFQQQLNSALGKYDDLDERMPIPGRCCGYRLVPILILLLLLILIIVGYAFTGLLWVHRLVEGDDDDDDDDSGGSET